jgi:hypothetical protein
MGRIRPVTVIVGSVTHGKDHVLFETDIAFATVVEKYKFLLRASLSSNKPDQTKKNEQ